MASLYFIFTFEILRSLFIALTQNHISDFYHLLWIYGIISLLVIGGRFLFYKTGWNPIMHDGTAFYYRKYLTKLVQADGNKVEGIGTGRFISSLTQ